MQQVPQPISKPALSSPNSPYYHNLEDIERIIMSAQPRVVVHRSTNNELEKHGKIRVDLLQCTISMSYL